MSPRSIANRNEDTDGTGLTFHHNKNGAGSGSETQYYAYGNLPDLNTANPYVQERVLALLEECIDAGIDGFRFDAAKHIETASDPDYPSDFWENTLEQAKLYYRQKTGRELYAYGEILNAPAGRSLELYTAHMRVTDDGYAAQMKNAFAKKDPTVIRNAALKTADAAQLIAWVESHDEYVTTNTHYSDVRVAKYWSVIAAKKGLGGLYLARPTEELTVGKIGSYAFESEYVAVSNRFHNRFYNAESYESTAGTCYINEKIGDGDQGALILNVGETDPEKTVQVPVPHLETGNYYDALTGTKVPVRDHIAYVQFEANGMAILTRTKEVHPRLSISERDRSFVGSQEITLKVENCDEAYYYLQRTERRALPHPGCGRDQTGGACAGRAGGPERLPAQGRQCLSADLYLSAGPADRRQIQCDQSGGQIPERRLRALYLELGARPLEQGLRDPRRRGGGGYAGHGRFSDRRL